MHRCAATLILMLWTVGAFATEEIPPPAKRDPLVIGATLVQRKSGCKVRALIDGGPAARAGLWIGDVILKVNDQSVEKLDTIEVARFISQKNPVALQVRDTTGKLKTVSVFKLPQSSLLPPNSKAFPTLPPDPLDELKPGDLAPLITAQYLDDRQITLAYWRSNPVVVIFWAQWSEASVAEIPALRDLYLKYHGLGLEFLGVNLDSDKVALDKFRTDKNILWPQHFDGLGLDGGVVREWGVTTVPTIALIGRDGKIIAEDLHGTKLESAVVAALGLEADYGKNNPKSNRVIRRPHLITPPPESSATISSATNTITLPPSSAPLPLTPKTPRMLLPDTTTNTPTPIPLTTEK